MRILVVEDEPKLNKGIVHGLKTRGYAVDFAFEGKAGETLEAFLVRKKTQHSVELFFEQRHCTHNNRK